MRGLVRGPLLFSLCGNTSSLSWTRRSFSTADNDGGDEFVQSSKLKIFDRDLKRKQVKSSVICTSRDRAAWLMRPKDPLVDTVAENLLDRLEDCKKTFPTALCLGGSLEAIRRLLRGRGESSIMFMNTDHVQRL
ncbi:hypothetical protein U1Q18_036893 [Sarracenia purpurea var. burkii]